jgi:ornithine carbamoyltransferase
LIFGKEPDMNHFLTVLDTPATRINHYLDIAFELRQERRQGKANAAILANKTLAMIFEKPSLRTRVSFEQAMYELGGRAIVLQQTEIGLGKREPVKDVARVLGGMVQGISARVFEHHKIAELAKYSGVPVVNALCDEHHPCQALADVMTAMDEFGRDLSGRTLAFIGDGNNVARSLAEICAALGMGFTLASPEGFDLPAEAVANIKKTYPAFRFNHLRDPMEAAKAADVLYTDTWVSMGQEAEAEERKRIFARYQINAQMLQVAAKDAIVMHCLPAYRGLEITDEMMEHPRSRVFPEAHNRLHAQKAVLAVLMGGV